MKISQRKTNTVCYHLYVNVNYKTNSHIYMYIERKQKQAHKHREQTNGFQWGEGTERQDRSMRLEI